MPARKLADMRPEIKIYLVLLALYAIAMGFSNDVLSNYFKDAYQVDSVKRGLIEFPRELPGMLVILVISSLAFLGDIRTAIIAQFFTMTGVIALGLLTPSFGVMLVFIFINSVGMHMFIPLQDGIAMSLIEEGKFGKRMGQFKGVSTAFQMIAAILVYALFHIGLVDFNAPVKWVFVASGVLLGGVLILLVLLLKRLPHAPHSERKMKFIFRKEYKYYYTLVVMFGAQKQIMMVYGPWVIIDLLAQKVDTIAILSILGSLVGIFFIPALGRWSDRFGLKAMLYADALSFIGVYVLYGLLSGGYASGTLATTGPAVFLAFALYIVDRMSSQMGFIRTVYLKSISVSPGDITPTLSLGTSMDHVVSITCAVLGGFVWASWGPQYIFYLAAALSLVNLYVAIRVKIPKEHVVQEPVLAPGAVEAIADTPAEGFD